ncbi:MAG: hypothetical protein H5U01_12955 [Clostridia bacterium]|nr:hypothetical protein [Clostridia bacterium]
MDVFPTVLELAGISMPDRWNGQERPQPPGKSIVPLFTKDGTVEHDFFWFLHEGNRAIRAGDWKLVAARGDPWELYNLAEDRGETNNLATKLPEKVAELESLWNRLWEQYQQDAKRDLTQAPASNTKPRKAG